MELIIKKQILENIIISTQSFLEKKDFSHITSHIYISADNGILNIKATDNEMGISINSKDLQIISSGQTTCNGKKILDIIKTLKNDNITLLYEKDFLFIKQGKTKYKLPVFNADEFPSFPNAQELEKVDIDSLKLINSFKKIMPSIDTNNPKFQLNGALIKVIGDTIHIVSTDTKRLSLVELKNNKDDLELSFILPKKAINEIQKLFINDIEMFFDGTNFIIKSQNIDFFSKVINGVFPNYERILPNTLKYQIELSKEAIIDAIKKVNIFSNEIRIIFYPESIVFENINEENFEAKTELEIKTCFEDKFTISVNSRFLIDFLSQIDTRTFLIGFNTERTPFELKSENLKTIIMPITV